MTLSRVPYRKALLTGLGAVAVLAGLVGAVFGGLQTDAGRRLAASGFETGLSAAGVKARIAELNELSPTRLRVGAISLGDPEAPWLTIDDLDLSWRPFDLLGGEFRAGSLTARGIALLRPPPSDTTPADTETTLPELPVGISIDHFAVETLTVASAVLGNAVTLGVDGEAFAGEDGVGSFRLDVRRRDGVAGSLSASAAYALRTRQLDLKLSLSEPADGVLVRLLDVPGRPPVDVSLNGSGSLDDWQGWLSGSAGPDISGDAAVKLALTDRLSLTADGRASLADILPEQVRDLASPRMDFSLEAAWDGESGLLDIARAEFDTAAIKATLAGKLETRQSRIDVRLSVDMPDGGSIAPLIAPAVLRSGRVNFTVGGELARPSGTLTAEAEDLSLTGATAEKAVLTADYRLDAGMTGPVSVESDLRFAGLAVSDPSLSALTGKEASLKAVGRIFQSGEIEISDAGIQVVAGTAAFSGTIDPATASADLAGSIDVPELSVFRDLLTLPVGGAGSVTAHLRAMDGELRGTFASEFRNVSLPQFGPQPLQVSAAGDFERARGGDLTLSNLAADANGVSIGGRAAFTRNFERLDAEYDVRIRDVSVLNEAVGIPMTGGLAATGAASGDVVSPDLTGRIGAEALTVAGTTYRDIRLDYDLADLAGRMKGTVRAELTHPWDQATLHTDLAVTDGGRLALRNIDLQSLGSRATGAVELDLEKLLAEGRIDATAPDLGRWASLLGVPVAGGLEATLDLRADGGVQEAVAEFDADRPRSGESVAAERLRGSVSLHDPLGSFEVEGRVRASGMIGAGLELETAEAEVSGNLDRLDYGLTVAGAEGTEVALSASGALGLGGDGLELTVARFSGTVLGRDVALSRPARLLRRGPHDLSVEEFALGIGEGQIGLDLRLSEADVDLDVRLDALPLSLAEFALPDRSLAGTLDGELHLSGAAASPDGDFRFSTRDVRLGAVGEDMPIRAAAEGRLNDGVLAFGASVEGSEDARLEVSDGRVPLKLSVVPFDVRVSGDGPVSGRIEGDGTLAMLVAPLLGDPHRVEGRLEISASLSGTADRPRAEGTARISGGQYENIVTGTVIREIAAEIGIRDTRLDIVEASGRAGDGTLLLGGRLDLLPADGFPLDLSLTANKADVVGRDDVQATASGAIALKGPVTDLDLSGKLTVDTAEVRFVQTSPPEVVTLEVTEVRGGQPVAAEQKPEPETGDSSLGLDLEISAPGRLFIRGRGLDSEWQGEIKLSGTAATPRLSGQVTPVRGQFSFAGKVFDLQKSSAVAFRDPDSVMPVLDITLVHEGKTVTARIRIQGSVDDPELTLSSTPQMPEDEIVSHVLFGRGVSKISGIEAAQLAQALATLSGMGGPSLTDTVRRTLGIDVLRVEAGDGKSSPSVTAGRYLADGVYVGVNQGADAKSGEAKVEVEITPNITVETEVGPQSGSQLGARWKFDY